MDVTINFYLQQIRKLGSSHWKSRKYTKEIAKQIGEYRLFARKNKGKKLAETCSREANRLEKELDKALG